MPCSIQSSARGKKAAVETGNAASSPAMEDPQEEGNSLREKNGRWSSHGSTCAAQTESKD